MKKTQLEKYKRSWQKRREKERAKLRRRRRKAKKVAQKCGRYLQEEYDVSSVYLVGSAAFSQRFHTRSDVDLLDRGLPDDKYFKALKDCWGLLPPGFELDLIPWEDAPESLKNKARDKGELLQ